MVLDRADSGMEEEGATGEMNRMAVDDGLPRRECCVDSGRGCPSEGVLCRQWTRVSLGGSAVSTVDEAEPL